jgi:hypothetical protein
LSASAISASLIRRIEEAPEQQPYVENMAQPPDDTDCQEGMAAKGKEIVVDSDLVELQHLRQDTHHLLFY